MGRVVAPFGVRGWIKVEPYTATVGSLTAYPVWWIGDGAEWREQAVVHARAQGRIVVAQLAGCDDREQAAGFRGNRIAVPRASLPEAQANEYYWVDLIGLRVVNQAGLEFGAVVRILETGANDVLVVEGERERLIPFIADVVTAVEREAGLLRVNWDADF